MKREKVVTVPNLLCVSRIAAAPLLAHLIVDKGDFPLAVALFAYAGVTDVVCRQKPNLDNVMPTKPYFASHFVQNIIQLNPTFKSLDSFSPKIELKEYSVRFICLHFQFHAITKLD